MGQPIFQAAIGQGFEDQVDAKISKARQFLPYVFILYLTALLFQTQEPGALVVISTLKHT